MSDLKIKKNMEGDVLNLKISGRITAVNAETITGATKDLFKNFKSVVIDASEIEYISSAGIRQFISLNAITKEKGGRVLIKNTNDEVKNILDTIGLLEVFIEEN